MAHGAQQLSPELEALLRTKWGARQIYSSYSEVQSFFNHWAFGPDRDIPTSIDHDTDVSGTYLGPDRIARLVLPRLQPKTRIIDICSGTGLSGQPFIERGHLVTGFDLSSRMLEKAKARGYQDTCTGNLLVDDLPWKEEFGALISVGALGEWIPPEDVLDKLFSLLSPQNAIVGITSEVEHTNIHLIRRIFKEHGFQIITSELGPGLRNPKYPIENYYYILAVR
ncbi:MAG: class I SAM-dependent methyltransferase [Desulfovermiculus sp.]|nr:class I SAM-dependent methyltransferase [Desulfovermiculus sp.]